MRRDTPWDWIIALAGLCFALGLCAWMTSNAMDCKRQGGTYAREWGSWGGYRCLKP